MLYIVTTNINLWFQISWSLSICWDKLTGCWLFFIDFCSFPIFDHLQLLFVLTSLTHADSGTLGFLYQQDRQWWGVNGLLQLLRGLTFSQRPHWSVRRNTCETVLSIIIVHGRDIAIQLRNWYTHLSTFHLKVLFSPKESHTDRKTYFLTLSHCTSYQQPILSSLQHGKRETDVMKTQKQCLISTIGHI